MIFDNSINMTKHIKDREYAILEEIRSVYDGEVHNGQDLDVFV